MPRFLRHRPCLLGALLALLAPVFAHAMTRVTLRNGFAYDCMQQQPLSGTVTRLILSAAPETSYIDVPTTEIVSVDTLPATSPAPARLATPQPYAPDIPTLLSSAGSVHNIDVELLASVVHAESGGRAHAVSRTGARGLMQLMPGTAQALGVADSFRPEDNINAGTAYLDALLTRYHDNLALALAAYNAGPGAVDRFHGVPPYRETRAYVTRVMTEFKRRKEALEHKTAHTLQASR